MGRSGTAAHQLLSPIPVELDNHHLRRRTPGPEAAGDGQGVATTGDLHELALGFQHPLAQHGHGV
jgi:hypothetical protein